MGHCEGQQRGIVDMERGNMVLENDFGRTVRQRRRALDLTQEELARRVGCAAVTLRKIEAGDLRPSQQIAERLHLFHLVWQNPASTDCEAVCIQENKHDLIVRLLENDK